jgi:hypothetical protein
MPVLAHPAAAWLAPAIILPIIFHLFFRFRKQVRDFPALLFFQRIDPRLSSKRKIHEWIVLFLRCLFIALLLAALLRPLLGVHQASGSVARLVLLDNSGSMAGPAHSGMTKWQLAKNATLHLISSLRPGDTVAVQLAVPDPTVALPDGFDATAATLRDAVQKLVVSDGAASVPKAMRRALAELDGAKAARRELIVITDLQRDNWTRGEFSPGPTTSRVVIRRIATPPSTTGEAAFQSMELPTRAIPAGRITPLEVSLQNVGGALAKARLNSSDDSGKNQVRELQVAPRGTGSGTLTFSFSTPGFHWAEWWIEGDTAPTAIRSDVGFWVTDVRKVLFVGTKDDFGALPYAVSPGGTPDLTGLDSVFIDPTLLATNLAADPLAVVTTWDRIDPALENYVRNGGTLLIVPRVAATTEPPAPAWVGATLGGAHTATDAEPMLLLEEGDPIWHDLRDSSGRPELGSLRAFSYNPVLAPGHDWTPLLAAGKGGTLLARRTLGKGRILASGLAFTPRESSLPLRAGFVVLVQNALFNGGSEPVPVRLIHAGDEIALPAGNISIQSLAGSPLAWTGSGRAFDGFPRAGVYEIKQPDHVEWVAVSGDPNEAHLDFLPLGPVPLLRNLPHDTAPLAHDDDLTHLEATPATTSSFYPWLLLAALLVILAETWLANERSADLGRNLFKALGGKKDAASGAKPLPAPKKAARPGKPVKVKMPAAAKPAKPQAAPTVKARAVPTPKAVPAAVPKVKS